MNKSDLVKAIAEGAGLTQLQAAHALDSFMDNVAKVLKKGETAAFVGFGTFKVTKRAGRTGRNPRTGAAIKIPARKMPRFLPGKKLKDAVA